MTRLAKKPIELPKGAECKVENRTVMTKGPKGTQSIEVPEGIDIVVSEQGVNMAADEKKIKRPFLGLYRALIKNALLGVTEGFQKKLTLIGVGFRAGVKGNALELQLGFSHPIALTIPEGLKVSVDKSTAITIEGIDKRLVGQFAADIRSVRPPEPYKGKGVRYENEYVRKKAGKSAKSK